jgi:hypothetical protein
MFRIESGEVGDEFVVLVPQWDEHKPIVARLAVSEAPGQSHCYAQFQWHIESSQVRIAAPLATAKIVDRVFRTFKSLKDAFHSRLGGRVRFQSRPGPEPASQDAENDASKQRFVLLVEGAIDENR